MYRYFLACLWAFPLVCIGQSKNKEANMLIKLNGVSLIDIHTFPTIQLGVEKKISKKISLEAELGYQVYNFNFHYGSPDTAFVHPSGIKAGITIRYYNILSSKETTLTGAYVGLNPFYRQNKYNYHMRYKSAGSSFSDDFWVSKKNGGLNVIWGYQRRVKSRFFIDVYGGLGILYREVKYVNREYDEDKGHSIVNPSKIPIGSAVQRWAISIPSGWAANFTLGFKFGYKIN